MDPIILICICVLTLVISIFFIYLILILVDIRFILKDTIKKVQLLNEVVLKITNLASSFTEKIQETVSLNRNMFSAVLSIIEVVKLFKKKNN
jgi:hypothetical protein